MTRQLPHSNDGWEPAIDDELVSVKEAGRMLSLTPWSVYQLINAGELVSGKEGKRRLVSRNSVRAKIAQILAGE